MVKNMNRDIDKAGAAGKIETVEPIQQIQHIGLIRSCYTEKFGIPRQPGMVASSRAQLELLVPFNREEMVRGLEQFSHLWVHFIFHQSLSEGWKPTVRPPWLGGQKRVGVFATRSPHRPNHLGLSVVRLEKVITGKSIILELSGVDFLDKTPVVDIKPYVPYSDSISKASCGFAQGEVPDVEISFSAAAKDFCHKYQLAFGRELALLIVETLEQDPRPASQKGVRESFGMQLWDVNIRWKVVEGSFFVESCTQLKS